MLTFEVDAARLSRSRFALSHLAELTVGIEVLARPGLAPQARSWVDRIRRRIEPASMSALFALVNHGSWYVPDFVVPVPDRYEPSLDDELAAVAAMPPDLVRYQLEMAFQLGPPPPDALRHSGAAPGRDPRWPLPRPVAAALADGGTSVLTDQVTEQLQRGWHLVLAESWPLLRRVLDEDVRHHAATASQIGFSDIVDQVHPNLSWDGERIRLEHRLDLNVDAHRGLVLMPSVFLCRPAAWLEDPRQPMVGYPARGRAQVWSSPREVGRDEARVLGPRRAALLADLRTPRSTTELAGRHQLSPSTVSYHLGHLHRSGLVTRRQAGHSVVYERTARAAGLLAVLDGDR